MPFARIAATAVGQTIRTFAASIPWQLYAALGAVALVWGAYLLGDRNGHAQERAAQIERNQKAQDARNKAASEAATADADAKTQGDAAITERRKELDDAKADIPDRPLTDRQRARRDAERVRAEP